MEKIEKEIEEKCKSEKNLVLDKYFKKPPQNEKIIKSEKYEKTETSPKDKTFGVLVLKKDLKIKNEKKEVPPNVADSLQKWKEKSESKKKIKKIIENKEINEKIELKRKDSNKGGVNINDKISSKINSNINNIINANSNISNNINIKININLNSKVEEDSDSSHNYKKNNILENNNTKIIEANIIHKNIPNNSNNNYNYDIKINNNNSKSSSSTSNIKVGPKKPKKQKTKKVSNLNELLGITPKKK